MGAPTFKLDKDAAKKADQPTSIQEGGKYTGVFLSAIAVKSSQKKTKAIQFEFQDEKTEAKANYLTIYYERADGTTIARGANQIHAIMACMGIEELTEKKSVIKVYDFEAKAEVDKKVKMFAELVNVPIGILFQKQLYTRGNGSDAARVNMLGVFDAKTGKTANEKLEGLEAEAIDKELKRLEVRDSRKSLEEIEKQNNADDSEEQPSTEFDDDIPF